jgi:hypothetical protein
MEDDTKPFVDQMLDPADPMAGLHEDSSDSHAPAGEGDGKPADGSTPPPAAAAGNPEVNTLRDEIRNLRDDHAVTQQQIAYWRGIAESNKRTEAPAEETPKPFQFNRDEFTAAMEKDPATAIYDLINKVQESGISLARKDIEGKVDGKLSEGQRREQMKVAYQRDADRVTKEFGDYVGFDESGKPKNSAFDNEALAESQERARERGNPQKPDGTYYLSPGDLYAAASVVYARWARAGKIQARRDDDDSGRRPLKEVMRTVDRSDDLGGGGNRRSSNATPKKLDDLLGIHFRSRREVEAARAFLKGQNEVTEERYVASILRNRSNGNISADN